MVDQSLTIVRCDVPHRFGSFTAGSPGRQGQDYNRSADCFFQASTRLM
jgi:hypothetical protein